MTLTHLPVYRMTAGCYRLSQIIQGMGVICGGYARWALSPDDNPAPPSDIDVYAFSVEDFEALKDILQKTLQIRVETNRAISFHKSDKLTGLPPVQLVKPVDEFRTKTYGAPDEIIENFDLTVSRAYLKADLSGGVADADFLEDETKKRLRVKNIHCPISSTLRMMKYVTKGYKVRHVDILPLLLDWEARPQSYRAQIADGLMGLDDLSEDDRTALYELLAVD